MDRPVCLSRCKWQTTIDYHYLQTLFLRYFSGLKPVITFIDHFYFQLPLKQKSVHGPGPLQGVHGPGPDKWSMDPVQNRGRPWAPGPLLSSTDSFASDFSPMIINISKIAILQTKFGHHFLGFYLTKMPHFWNLSSG